MPEIFDKQLTTARYSKKQMGIGQPGFDGGGAFMFFSTQGIGRDLDDTDVATCHRFIHLWNAACGLPTEVAMQAMLDKVAETSRT